jgi:hypothetical protein
MYDTMQIPTGNEKKTRHRTLTERDESFWLEGRQDIEKLPHVANIAPSQEEL